jgi:hypothetical protein
MRKRIEVEFICQTCGVVEKWTVCTMLIHRLAKRMPCPLCHYDMVREDV